MFVYFIFFSQFFFFFPYGSRARSTTLCYCSMFTLDGRQIFVRYDTAINNDCKQWLRKQYNVQYSYIILYNAGERVVRAIGVKSRLQATSSLLPAAVVTIIIIFSYRTPAAAPPRSIVIQIAYATAVATPCRTLVVRFPHNVQPIAVVRWPLL